MAIFNNTSETSEIRVQFTKIIVSLTFDNQLDDYKFIINNFLNFLKDKPINLMHYDLIGAFEGIETQSICKYFYKKLN
jgi:hypothetical protein